MVGSRKKKIKVSEEEDRISQLPNHLICHILYHLSPKDAVRTSEISTKWRNLWRCIPDLDLVSNRFSSFDAFVRFVESFFDSHRESWIHKLRLSLGYRDRLCDLTSWIDAVTTRRIQHLDVNGHYEDKREIPLSVYTCKTLVHLRLCAVTLCNAEFLALPCLKIMDLRFCEVTLWNAELVSLPCLKIMHLEGNICLNKTMLQKLISCSPVMEDLTIIRSRNDDKASVLQVRSHTLKRAYIKECTFVIDAPLLQCLKATVSSPKNFQIINLGFPAKLVIDSSYYSDGRYNSSMIRDILTDITRFRELVISNDILMEIFRYATWGPVFQFRDLSRLNVKFFKTDLKMLPTILESCPKLESFALELVKDDKMLHKNRQSKVMFSTVPQCLVTSLKFVEWKRKISWFEGWYEGEAELVRYLLKNSTILEKIRLDVYYTEKAKCDFLTELLTMPRCSTVCEVHCSIRPKSCCSCNDHYQLYLEF